jgi:beta-glucanase (GH16 family)
VSEAFQTYKLDWTPEKLIISANGRVLLTYAKLANALYDTWPFDSDFNILLNTAVGGDHGIDDSIFPQIYTIDYIKYTKFKGQLPGPVVPSTFKWVVDRWSGGCDWLPGNDLSSVDSKREECASKCSLTTECSHFTWIANLSGDTGSCLMKKGPVKQENVMSSGNASFICGYRSEESIVDKLKIN